MSGLDWFRDSNNWFKAVRQGVRAIDYNNYSIHRWQNEAKTDVKMCLNKAEPKWSLESLRMELPYAGRLRRKVEGDW